MNTVRLEPDERAMLDGERGEGVALAMRVVVALARASGAERLVRIECAHVDGGLYHGQAGLDFAERLVNLGARTSVPTTLNVGSLDLLHPGLVRGDTAKDEESMAGGRRLMDAYVALGARATFTCAPYQQDNRPEAGTQVAWGESNAIAFVNSVLGARTDRYGDFLDICAAITGRAPYAGLHLDEHRRGGVVFDCTEIGADAFGLDVTYPLLGYIAGSVTGSANPVFIGLPPTISEDHLKSLGAAAASSGGVALFHVIGVTPEAPTLDAALHGRPPARTETITPQRLLGARNELTTSSGEGIDAVSVGTPHASVDELRELASLVSNGPGIDPAVDVYVSTGRSVFEEADRLGYREMLESAGVRIVLDTCTYVTSILRPETQVVMTNSGKWAHYAPANLGVDVVLGTLAECVTSARMGRVMRDDDLFG